MFGFLSTVIAGRTDASISASDLHSWLRAWPWVVILDGLDEVSDAELRRVLLERVTDLIETADTLRADLLVVATTRPLGYDERFDPELFTDIQLSRLTPPQARDFAAEIVGVRLAEDPDLRDRVMARLDSASEDPATRRLMETPLQVTIMSIIVEAYGVLPVDRFGLFSLYYRTVYQREADKPGSSIARILNEHKSDIDYLHARVALHLHVAAENAETNPSISITQLEEITRDRLRSQEYLPRDIDTISGKLITAATHRLVLLVPAGDRIGFEVRSLQELMAAIAITTGPEVQALRLLTVTMHHPHWRNIWLLGAGRPRRTVEQRRCRRKPTSAGASLRAGAGLRCSRRRFRLPGTQAPSPLPPASVEVP
jgi:predicted NACHT family NTPase